MKATASEPDDKALDPERDSGRWLCRSCACISKVRYVYPLSPWIYCQRCEGPLTPSEQIVAVARLQSSGELPAVLMPTAPREPPAEKGRARPLATVREVAALLNTTPAAIYAMKARGRLPGVTKVGRRVLFRRDALLRWLAEGEPRR